jgi:hypothetical protein
MNPFKIYPSKPNIIMKTAYIVKAYRTAVGKAPKGVLDLKT